jgi:hypothetical protein
MVCVMAWIVSGSVEPCMALTFVLGGGGMTESMDESDTREADDTEALDETTLWPRCLTDPLAGVMKAWPGRKLACEACLEAMDCGGAMSEARRAAVAAEGACRDRRAVLVVGVTARLRRSSGTGDVGREGPVDIFLSGPFGGGIDGGGGRFMVGGLVLSGVGDEGGIPSIAEVVEERSRLTGRLGTTSVSE